MTQWPQCHSWQGWTWHLNPAGLFIHPTFHSLCLYAGPWSHLGKKKEKFKIKLSCECDMPNPTLAGTSTATRGVPACVTTSRRRKATSSWQPDLSPEEKPLGCAFRDHKKNSLLWPGAALWPETQNYFSLPGGPRRAANSVQDFMWQREEDTQPSRETQSVRTVWVELLFLRSTWPPDEPN